MGAYKSIEELYLAVGVAGAIVIVFLALFTYLVINSDKKRTEQMDSIVDKVSNLQLNDTDFKHLIESLTDSVKELSTTNRVVAETVHRLDYYNKDLQHKLEKHDAKADRVLDKLT